MNLEENSCRNHESLRQKRQESWISRFKWFRFKPRLFEISDCWPLSVFKTFSDLIPAIQKQRLLNMHKEFNEMKCIQTYVQSVSNKSTYRSTEYSLFRQGDCVAPLRVKRYKHWTVTNSSQGPVGFINHAEGRNDGLGERVLVLLGLINCRSFKSKILF